MVMTARLRVAFSIGAMMLVSSIEGNAAENYLQGAIVDMSSASTGLMIKLDSGVPTSCSSTPFNWMLVRAQDKAMIALVMMMYSTGKRSAVVYTNGIGPSGYCEVSQYDPIEA